MTRPELYKVGGSLLVLALGWWFGRRRPPGTGDVNLGVPTVIGSGSEQLGDQGYYSDRPPVVQPTGGDLVSDPVREAIETSREAIDAYEVPPNPWGIE